MNKLISISLFCLVFYCLSCERDKVRPASAYDCMPTFNDSSALHPKAAIYQDILDENQKDGLVGAVLLVKDADGLWIGASGKADIASDVNMKPCNVFLIASISKTFTSAAVYRYIDKGILSLDDPIQNWLPTNAVEKINNAKQATIKDLLAHTSGIADFYTLQFELDRINKVNNNWTQEEVLTYTYGQEATNEVGTYSYSNTNFLLLAMILEKASGLKLEQVYQQEVFTPLNLTTAYYSAENPIPEEAVKGYADIYGHGDFVESSMVYEDELGIGGDGGIAINAYDLSIFLQKLLQGELISEQSLIEMTSWFSMPDIYHWKTYGQIENGVGIEKFDTEYGLGIGHTGSIDGFLSYGFYFPEKDFTYILLLNSTSDSDANTQIYQQTIKMMFD